MKQSPGQNYRLEYTPGVYEQIAAVASSSQ